MEKVNSKTWNLIKERKALTMDLSLKLQEVIILRARIKKIEDELK